MAKRIGGRPSDGKSGSPEGLGLKADSQFASTYVCNQSEDIARCLESQGSGAYDSEEFAG
jgi:hypothetical protein